ncbi:hypothetical protein BT63DRAFT_422417 [Microthyrium microscopicum]|uniref:FAD-binding FR-type domain-containing protein n=1 Tax=Microthyrium microscopicum TaxID=703497 RepID=A0A6A6UK52_9PEZI|nr:hypothetical protein BT63DRAFT_422417 [Microthyrium microscopicum]
MTSTYFSSLLFHLRARPIVSLLACSSALGVGYYAPLYYTDYQRRRQLALNPTTFTPYTLIAKHPISATSSIFILRPPSSPLAASQLSDVWSSASSLWSVQAKQPQLQIGREYTPLPPSGVLNGRAPGYETPPNSHSDASADIHLLIRKEANGEMTTYLHSLPPAADVSLRGPYQDVRIPSHVDEVLVLAGGTGISPAMQVAHILSQRRDARITILWANRRREECVGAPIAKAASGGMLDKLWSSKTSAVKKEEVKPEEKGLVVQILEEMQTRVATGALRVEYFVDEEDTFIKHSHVRSILAAAAKPVEGAVQTPSSGRPGAKLILVSGPQGFIDYWAGRKRLEGGQEKQGPIGGALGEMDLHGWKVWKL